MGGKIPEDRQGDQSRHGRTPDQGEDRPGLPFRQILQNRIIRRRNRSGGPGLTPGPGPHQDQPRLRKRNLQFPTAVGTGKFRCRLRDPEGAIAVRTGDLQFGGRNGEGVGDPRHLRWSVHPLFRPGGSGGPDSLGRR